MVWTGRKSGWHSEDTCSFTHVQVVCSLRKVRFVTDVATGAVKLATSLDVTKTFLKTLGCLYDSFGVHCPGEASEGCTLRKQRQMMLPSASLLSLLR